MIIKRYLPEFLIFFIVCLIFGLVLKIEIKFYHVIIIFTISYFIGKMIFKFLDVMPDRITHHEKEGQMDNDLFSITFIIGFLSRGQKYAFMASYNAKEKIETSDLNHLFYENFNRKDLKKLLNQGELTV